MSNGSGDWDGLGGIDTVGKRLVPGVDLGSAKIGGFLGLSG
ncbi:hypothetical protein [Candidatus Coxiella mudrowiae]|nr:hypothetical protein [Candidatus Coxiella mudrowiae]